MVLNLLSLIGRPGSLHFWLRLPLWSLTACIVVSSCILIAKKPNLKHLLDAWKTRKSGAKALPNVDTGILSKMGRVAVVLGLSMASFLAGYGWRDHQLASKQVTYTEVLVRQKLSDHRFLMQPARMKPIESDICPESAVDWRESEVLADWTFEQKKGCKRVISYHRPPQGDFDAQVSLR